MDKFCGAIDINSKEVRQVLEGGKACGYEAKKAERFFHNNPEVKDYVIALIENLPENAQGRFEEFCRFSKEKRIKVVRDLLLESVIKSKKPQKISFEFMTQTK